MKRILLILFLFPFFSFAQLEKLLKKPISDELINKSMITTAITIAADSISYMKIPYEMVNKMITEDPKVMVNGCKFCDLNTYIKNIDEAIDNITSDLRRGGIPYINKLQSDIIMAHQLYPEIKLEGYYSLIKFFDKVKNHNDEKNIAQQKIIKENQRREDIKRDSIARYNYSVERYNDSVRIAKENSDYKNQEEEEIKKQNEDFIRFRKFCIGKFGVKRGNMIADGKVALGMTKSMCEYAWGQPSRTDQTKIGVTLYETWFYGKYYTKSLMFKNGILMSITQ